MALARGFRRPLRSNYVPYVVGRTALMHSTASIRSDSIDSCNVTEVKWTPPKSVAQRRKENKQLREQLFNDEAAKEGIQPIVHFVGKTESRERKTRFKLGNGFNVLTCDSLLGLVQLTAPFYFDTHLDDVSNISEGGNVENPTESSIAKLSSGKDGWLKILTSAKLSSTDTPTPEQRIDYFALCMASHFATCATFVPTDVDSKIRGHCWLDPDESVLLGQLEVVKNALKWDVDSVSNRNLHIDVVDSEMPVSGHDGEWLGVLCGAWGCFLKHGKLDIASEIEALIVKELDREARSFDYLRSLPSDHENDKRLLQLCAIMTHNVGDVDQGLSYWKNYKKLVIPKPEFNDHKSKYAELAHERYDRFNGAYGRAKLLYKELLSAEGHRNYPLRETKCLRASLDLALPIGPWLEDWGRTVATHPAISEEDLVSIITQLIRGCDTESKGWCVPNQVGYYRALHGIAANVNFDAITQQLCRESRAFLKNHEIRMHLSLSPQAFAAKLGKKARTLLESVEDPFSLRAQETPQDQSKSSRK